MGRINGQRESFSSLNTYSSFVSFMRLTYFLKNDNASLLNLLSHLIHINNPVYDQFITMLNSKKITLHYLTPEQKTPSKPIHTQASYQTQQIYSHPTNQSFSSIDPTWHLVASIETVLHPKIKAKQKYFFQSMQSYNTIIEEAFVNHCATIIQKNFKGYMQRKYYRKFLPVYRRVRNLLEAMSAGWKVRRIMELRTVKKRRKEIEEAQSRKQEKRIRILKRDFSYEIKQLQKKGRWVQILRLERGLMNKKITQNKSKHKEINLKEAFNKKKQIQSIKKNEMLNSDSRVYERALQMSSNIKTQEEKPIAAKGFYELPQNQEIASYVQRSVTSSMHIEKKTKKVTKKPIKKNEKEITLPSNKNNLKNIVPQKIQQQPKQTKIAKFDCSLLSIHLPEQQQVMPENTMKLLNRKLSLQMAGAPLLNNTPKNNEPNKERKRNFGKGLTVTLANSKVQEINNSKIENFNFTGPLSLYVESSRSMSMPEKMKIERKQIEKYGRQTILRQILEAYVGPYEQKRVQIQEKLLKVKSQDKFRKGLKFS